VCVVSPAIIAAAQIISVSNNLAGGNYIFKNQHIPYFIKKRRICSHLLWESAARNAMTFLPG
jgi:hypothetical protein